METYILALIGIFISMLTTIKRINTATPTLNLIESVKEYFRMYSLSLLLGVICVGVVIYLSVSGAVPILQFFGIDTANSRGAGLLIGLANQKLVDSFIAKVPLFEMNKSVSTGQDEITTVKK